MFSYEARLFTTEQSYNGYISTIYLLNFEPVPTLWYALLFILLDFGTDMLYYICLLDMTSALTCYIRYVY